MYRGELQEFVNAILEVRRSVDTPIMVDEGLHSIYDAQRLIEYQACDILRLNYKRWAASPFARKYL